MTRDDIIKWANEAGLLPNYEVYDDDLIRFAAFVAAAEREACAKVCEHKMPNPVCNWSDAQIVEALRDCAAAIRTRNNK